MAPSPSLPARSLAELAQAYREARKAARLTQAEVAARAGLRRETVVKLESAGNVDTLTLLKAVGALGSGLRLAEVGALSFEDAQALFAPDDDEES